MRGGPKVSQIKQCQPERGHWDDAFPSPTLGDIEPGESITGTGEQSCVTTGLGVCVGVAIMRKSDGGFRFAHLPGPMYSKGGFEKFLTEALTILSSEPNDCKVYVGGANNEGAAEGVDIDAAQTRKLVVDAILKHGFQASDITSYWAPKEDSTIDMYVDGPSRSVRAFDYPFDDHRE